MIRRLQKKDRIGVISVIDSVDIFSDEEKDVAIELVDEALELKKPDEFDYNVFVYVDEKKIKGFHCTGKRYMTDGVFDLYWIIVDANSQNRGIGKQLLKHVDRFVEENNGYLVIAETSGTKKYIDTRKFYLNNDYKILADIKDFYKINDDLIIFGKYLIT